MPSSQVTKTPVVIQQSWNDGLFTLRDKRNGLARGTSIEEKCMYVLGLGWKFRGASEVKDNEIETTLFVSLAGLTQESKLLKIGQVLWEQCDESFILKMISSLSNNTPSQSRMYQQISSKEMKNYKGYFSKAANKTMSRSSIDPGAILNRESRQMTDNNSMRKNEALKQKKKDFAQSNVSSKGFENRLLKFKTNNKNIKRLATELEVILKTTESDNLIYIASGLGIYLESGFNKRYIIEQIKSVVCSYVEFEIMSAGSSTSKNIFLKPDVVGFDIIKRLLRFTSFSMLATDDVITVKELDKISSEIANMRNTMKNARGILGGFKQSKLDKQISKRDKFLDKVKKTESKGSGVLFSNMFKKASNKSKFKLKKNMAEDLYKFLKDNISSDTGVNFSWKGDFTSATDQKAIERWLSDERADIELARNIATMDTTDKTNKLTFEKFTREKLLARLVTTVGDMGIEKEMMPTTSDGLFLPNDPSFYILLILRRFAALMKESKSTVMSTLMFGKKNRNKKGQLAAVIEKISDNSKQSADDRKRNDERFKEVADGVFKPVSVSGTALKEMADKMQPVYVVGGSVYTFGSGGGDTSGGVMTEGLKSEIESKNRRNKAFANKITGKASAYKHSKNGGNMGAFGTQDEPLEFDPSRDTEKFSFAERVINAKMMNELSKEQIPIIPTIQPVFVVNKGINTSNVETTALLNLVPTILNAIPMVGTAAGMAFKALLQSQIDAAKNLPKFARGGSFTTRNSNVSQFISGDSINNKINPERVTIDWASQRVNVQPLNQTTNNVTNVETGRVTDPIMGTSTTVKISGKNGKTTEAIGVYNAVNPFDENISAGTILATPMEVLVSLKESLVDILGTLTSSNQTSQVNASMTAKVVDAINNLNGTMQTGSGKETDIFSSLNILARGE